VLVCTVGVLYDEVVRTEIPDETAEGGNGHPIPRQWLVGLRKRGNDGCCVSFDLAPFSGTRVFLRWLVCADTSTMSACVQEKHVTSFRVRPPFKYLLSAHVIHLGPGWPFLRDLTRILVGLG
jgi:hypothetical protein